MSTVVAMRRAVNRKEEERGRRSSYHYTERNTHREAAVASPYCDAPYSEARLRSTTTTHCAGKGPGGHSTTSPLPHRHMA